MPFDTFNTLRVSWVLLCVLLLGGCVATYNGTTGRDNDILLGFCMAGLSFPSSY